MDRKSARSLGVSASVYRIRSPPKTKSLSNAGGAANGPGLKLVKGAKRKRPSTRVGLAASHLSWELGRGYNCVRPKLVSFLKAKLLNMRTWFLDHGCRPCVNW